MISKQPVIFHAYCTYAQVLLFGLQAERNGICGFWSPCPDSCFTYESISQNQFQDGAKVTIRKHGDQSARIGVNIAQQHLRSLRKSMLFPTAP